MAALNSTNSTNGTNGLRRESVSPDKTAEVGPDRASLTRKLQGVLLFRLLLGVFFLVLTLFFQSRRAGDLLSTQLTSLYTFSLILFLFTIVASISLKKVRQLVRFAYIQVFFDVASVTFLIYLSGGVASVFSFLYMPAIVSGAVLLHRRGSMVAATACALSYGLLLDLQYFGWVSPVKVLEVPSPLHDIEAYFYSLLMNIAGYYLTAYLSGYLAKELLESSRQVREHRKDFRELEFIHRNIIHSLNSGLLMISPGGEILFSNHAAHRILDLPVARIDGRSVTEMFPDINLPAGPDDAAQSLALPPRPSARREFAYRRPTGEEMCLGYSVSFLKTDSGATRGWVLIFQDLTRLKSMEDHLQRMERVAYAGKMAAEIAHEIRNPLAAISGVVQVLQSETPQESFQAKLMNIVSREVNRIDDLITDFLWLARGSQKSQKIEEVSVCTVVEAVFADLKARAKVVDGHRFERHFETLPVFMMDTQHLRQMLWHLMVNAVEAMPAGGVLSVRVAGAPAHDRAAPETLIEIADTGSGIAAADRDHIFEPFFTTKMSGTGLGLSIVLQLMENLGGRIEVHPGPASGTSVSLFFPFDPAFPLAK